jgi:biopolymer transport protein ExbD
MRENRKLEIFKMRQSRSKAKIDIIPLVDVLMVLIIFFLVTMQFQDLRALNVQLPEIKTAGSNLLDGQLAISIDREGSFELNGMSSTKTEIQKVMTEVSRISPETKVLIAADEDVPLKFVTEVVDLCRISGLSDFRLQSR